MTYLAATGKPRGRHDFPGMAATLPNPRRRKRYATTLKPAQQLWFEGYLRETGNEAADVLRLLIGELMRRELLEERWRRAGVAK